MARAAARAFRTGTRDVVAMRTAKNIVQHELIGLRCRVAKARNKSLEGIEGRVVDETMKSLVVETAKGRKHIMKGDAVFRFYIEDAQQAVDVDGNMIIARPEDRIKKMVKRW